MTKHATDGNAPAGFGNRLVPGPRARLPQFIMLDHSLTRIGGHHYEYALNVLRAAEAAGREIVVGAHVDFERAEEFSGRWRVLPVFRRSAYNEFNIFTASAKAGRMVDLDLTWDAPRGRWSERWQRLRDTLDCRNLHRTHRRAARAARKLTQNRQNLMEQCVADCRSFFTAIDVADSDVVFVPTLTEFDLIWITRFLKAHPHFCRVPWHLQFHFNFLEGREPDYAEQATRLARMRRHFQTQLDPLPNHCLHLYTTTEQLAAQHNRLQIGPFRCLPYPVNPDLKTTRRGAERPLRVVSAGCIRAEKGYDHYGPLIEALWNEHLTTGRLQLVVQTDDPQFSLTLPNGRPVPLCDGQELDGFVDQPVLAVRAPLDVKQYTRLIGSADIGMFLYDADRYYTRCSGVLVEMIACGVPVIVPAGSWLSEQITEPNSTHLEALLQRSTILKTWRTPDLSWHSGCVASPGTPCAGAIEVGGEDHSVTATISLPDGSGALLVVLAPGHGWTAGNYVRVSADLLDQTGKTLDVQKTILGCRAPPRPVPALIRLVPGATSARLRLKNAFRNDRLAIQAATIHCLADPPAGALPTGARGLIAASTDQVPALLTDIVNRYSHYRATAAAYAPHWTYEHHPQRTVEILLSCAAGSGKAPLRAA